MDIEQGAGSRLSSLATQSQQQLKSGSLRGLQASSHGSLGRTSNQVGWVGRGSSGTSNQLVGQWDVQPSGWGGASEGLTVGA